MLRRRYKERLGGYLFICPTMLLYGVLVLYPLLRTIALSTTDWDGLSPTINFVGLENYFTMVHDPIFWIALGNNILWTLLTIGIPMVFALILAVLLSGHVRFRNFFRTVYFIPVTVAPILVGLIWGWMYNPIFGVIAVFAKKIGLGFLARGWLGDPVTVVPALALAFSWTYFGFCMVIFLAALQNIDVQLFDAAKLDGANGIQVFLHIIIPVIRQKTTFVIVLSMIVSFKVFDIIYITTQGGPMNSSEVLATYLYDKAFVRAQFGYGSALSVMLTLIVLSSSFVVILARERKG